MTGSNSSYLRTLERMQKAVAEALAQTPETPGQRRAAETIPLPGNLDRVVAQLTRIEETLSRAEVNAAGVENLLRTEADVFAAWHDTLTRVTAQLQTWADDGKSPA